ncbi:ribonucleotide-diphosphate reductase subunit beta [Spirillospora sp. CA-294931]|uniref:ribonucleotide-diphosphate reductase subunit beta n=1 Tax=Spirillospora sp. CA-294931 TaxID=3240042 RepID=UPI003D8D029C
MTAPTPEITDAADARDASLPVLPTPRQLYDRWEKQQWAVADVEVARDAPGWERLRPFLRAELLAALAELEVGEVCVTQTLSSLVDHAPDEDGRVFLCAQLADEGRHVRFFQDYLTLAAGVDLADPDDGKALAAAAAYGNLFEPTLRASTARVRQPGEEGETAWYRALVQYHLITEGVLAATALRTVRTLARRLDLRALTEGLTNVTRDETRHVTYGLVVARHGVAAGRRDTIAETYLAGTALAARVMVAPGTRAVTPVMRMALVHRARQLSGQWEMARDRMLRQLAVIGLPELREEAGRVWAGACESAMDEYRERWSAEHPVRRAAA